jgi:hypothetical protein
MREKKSVSFHIQNICARIVLTKGKEMNDYVEIQKGKEKELWKMRF